MRVEVRIRTPYYTAVLLLVAAFYCCIYSGCCMLRAALRETVAFF